MAQSALKQQTIACGVYHSMVSPACLDALYQDLAQWLAQWQADPQQQMFRSFAALFAADQPGCSERAHHQLWHALRSREPQGRPAPDGTSDEVTDPHYAFALHGTAFFVVGLSPQSPRLARRTAYTGFVLNPHDQFELLRARGQMACVQTATRRRDTALQGDMNPLLADHGAASAALQYSAHPVSLAELCPFATKKA
jgi:FPC/CPF motif-containing protein YcgG